MANFLRRTGEVLAGGILVAGGLYVQDITNDLVKAQLRANDALKGREVTNDTPTNIGRFALFDNATMAWTAAERFDREVEASAADQQVMRNTAVGDLTALIGYPVMLTLLGTGAGTVSYSFIQADKIRRDRRMGM